MTYQFPHRVVAGRWASFIETWRSPARSFAKPGMAMPGEKIPAQQAADWGLIWKCVEDGELAGSVAAIEQQLPQCGPLGLERAPVFTGK